MILNCGSMLKKIWEKQVIRYLICGALTATFNILLISGIIELLKLDTPLLRNLANLGSTEISLLFSFIVYRLWVWPSASWKLQKIFFHQIPLYHLSTGISILIRSFVLFPLLDWMGVHYSINTLVGIAVGSALNYSFSDRIVFRAH